MTFYLLLFNRNEGYCFCLKFSHFNCLKSATLDPILGVFVHLSKFVLNITGIFFSNRKFKRDCQIDRENRRGERKCTKK